jgi:hypothetical protein
MSSCFITGRLELGFTLSTLSSYGSFFLSLLEIYIKRERVLELGKLSNSKIGTTVPYGYKI